MMRVLRTSNLYLVIISLFLSMRSALAGEDRPLRFPALLEKNGVQMELKGIGLKRFFFIKAFKAAFYLDTNVQVDQVLSNVSKKIDVSYFINISGNDLSNYTEALMQKNMSEQEFRNIREKIQKMRSYFVDLKPGDRYSITYIPEVGTQFEHNEHLKGIIEGDVFAFGLFSTWIGERPMDKRIKSSILGLKTSEYSAVTSE